MSQNRNSNRRGSVTDKTTKQKAQTNRSEVTDTMPCRDCAVPVLDGEQGLKCDLCDHWLHAKCKKITEAAYNFLSDNDNEAIKWYCSHCKPPARPTGQSFYRGSPKHEGIHCKIHGRFAIEPFGRNQRSHSHCHS